jgi:hypothetical protein
VPLHPLEPKKHAPDIQPIAKPDPNKKKKKDIEPQKKIMTYQELLEEEKKVKVEVKQLIIWIWQKYRPQLIQMASQSLMKK